MVQNFYITDPPFHSNILLSHYNNGALVMENYFIYTTVVFVIHNVYLIRFLNMFAKLEI